MFDMPMNTASLYLNPTVPIYEQLQMQRLKREVV